MELRYSYDPEKWYLGTPCRNGHRWPGSGLSIRYNYKGSARCAGCSTNPEAELPWLFRFIDLDASGVPAGHRLGKLCLNEHSWNGTGYSLRKHGKCIECEKIRIRAKNPDAEKAYREKYYEANCEQLAEYAKQRYQRRKENGEHLLYLERSRVKRAEIKRAGRMPSVLQLVINEQRSYWRKHSDDKRKHDSQRSAYYYSFRYMCDPAFRRHECQRNSERKAKNRGNHTVRLNSNAIAERFAQFDNSCAYCGSTTHLIVEHFIPRAKGGPHALGNLLPACQRCNVSKRDHDPEHWYQDQPFYTKARWRKILAVLGKAKALVHQLPLL